MPKLNFNKNNLKLNFNKNWNYEEIILFELRKHPSLCVDSLHVLTNIKKDRLCLKLASLRKFGYIQCFKRKTSYWKIKKDE